MAFSLCQNCGREFVSTDQIRSNDRAVLAAKRHADGLMSPEDIRRARELFGLSQEKAAEVFGGGRNAFSKYERGEVAQSVAMDRLIRLCVAHSELVDELKDFIHLAGQVVSRNAEVISLQEWQQSDTPVREVVYSENNTAVRSITVVAEQDVLYGS